MFVIERRQRRLELDAQLAGPEGRPGGARNVTNGSLRSRHAASSEAIAASAPTLLRTPEEGQVMPICMSTMRSAAVFIAASSQTPSCSS
jgi:hypothetical protein